jgi:putative endopeptidase
MDTAAEACTDFYQYGNGTWLANNPIPPDRPRWGSFDELRQTNLDDLHGILDRLAADKSAPAGSDERKLGDFYAACMDEAAIETKGLSPIEPELAKIDKIQDVAGLRAEITRLQKMGVNALFTFGSEEDRKDSSRVIAALLQAGLGPPDRDYYTKTDEKSVDSPQEVRGARPEDARARRVPSAKAAADAKAIPRTRDEARAGVHE